MLPFTQDLGIFYATIYGGLLIGVLFDIRKALKINFKFFKYIPFFFDVIFWIFATLLIFVTINTTEFFDLRYYHFIALIIGFLIYYVTISKYVLSIMDKIIYFSTRMFIKLILSIVGFVNNLYYVIIYSLHLIFDIIFYIPNLLVALFEMINRNNRLRMKKHNNKKSNKKKKNQKKHKKKKRV